jgi:hypothetical protein
MGYLLSLQNLDQRADEHRDILAVSTISTTLCFSTASTTIC